MSIWPRRQNGRIARTALETLSTTWNRLDLRARAFTLGGLAALAVVLLILGRVATAPSFALLYSGLEPAAAGEVVAALEARGVPYRVSGDTIEVEAGQRDSLRMALAGEGLPANGPQGYELLDSLSGFGTTSQMFDAAYWRAKEGELARTIHSSPQIRAARVHIANPSADPFQPVREVTASVAVRPAAGGLAPGHPEALRYLVASSVPGLLPQNVAIIDADSGRVLGGEDSLTPARDAAGRSEELRHNVERLLAARVGPGNAVVQVSVEIDTSRETILERRIDPESRVVVSSETEERDDTSTDSGGNGVTVASNLPDGDAASQSGTSSAQASETRERVTFDLSETQREIAREPGAIRRISVAVLLNGVRTLGEDGIERVVPRPAEELQALEALVRSAVGYDEARGDSVTVQSMAFDAAAVTELTPPGLLDRIQFDAGRLVQTLILAAVALVIAFGIVRPALRGGAARASEPADPALPYLGDVAALDTAGPEDDLADTSGAPGPVNFDNLPSFPQVDFSGFDGAFGPGDTIEADAVTRLKRLIEEREEETVDILRSWMEEDEERMTR
jgi:flagellar M-ring protein FliF